MAADVIGTALQERRQREGLKPRRCMLTLSAYVFTRVNSNRQIGNKQFIMCSFVARLLDEHLVAALYRIGYPTVDTIHPWEGGVFLERNERFAEVIRS